MKHVKVFAWIYGLGEQIMMTQVCDCRSNHHCYTNHPQITLSYPSHILPTDYLSFSMLFLCVNSHSFAPKLNKWAVHALWIFTHHLPSPTLCNHRLLPYLAVCAVLTHPTTPYQPIANLKTEALRSVHFLLSGRHKWVRKDKTFLDSTPAKVFTAVGYKPCQ